MRILIFCHSLLSDWNHGNAHFLRGIASELAERGHDVRAYEPSAAWSVQNLIAEVGGLPWLELSSVYPKLCVARYDQARLDLAEATAGADLVLVHEWNEPWLVQELGWLRARGARYRLLFHDTHHRSVSEERAIAGLDLSGYDGVLAFGEALRQRYLALGWARRVWTWHEAADTRVFRPRPELGTRGDLVWIGNWGDGERSRELQEYLLEPVAALRLRATVHGVRYPETGVAALRAAGIRYAGWLANYRVPEAFARHRVTVHVPRRPYVEALPGIPTIRVFEALACGIPLVSAPWNDSERLFRSDDYVRVTNGGEMQAALRRILADGDYARELAQNGLETVLARHTCAHRVDELFAIYGELRGDPAEARPRPLPVSSGVCE